MIKRGNITKYIPIVVIVLLLILIIAVGIICDMTYLILLVPWTVVTLRVFSSIDDSRSRIKKNSMEGILAHISVGYVVAFSYS